MVRVLNIKISITDNSIEQPFVELKYQFMKKIDEAKPFLKLQPQLNNITSPTLNNLNCISMTDAMVEISMKLAFCGLDYKQSSNNCGIIWKGDGHTNKITKRVEATQLNGENWYDNAQLVKTLENDVLLWSGVVKNESTLGSNYAQKMPFFKARGIIHSANARELTELLIDSSKVKLYNKYSNGRVDSIIFQNDLDIESGAYGNGCTKIVQNETNVPLTNKKVKTSTLFHARALSANNPILKSHGGITNAFIIVTRTVHGESERKRLIDVHMASLGSTNEIIWGINLLLDVPEHPGKTDLITITQANSSSVPSFLLQKVSCFLADLFCE